MAVPDYCANPPLSRRRSFWTTQPDACGDYYDCGDHCAIPSLKYIEAENGRTISTENWIHSILLNILNTRARVPKTKCGNTVVSVGGHWSESYRQDGLYVGTRIWAELQQPVSKIQDMVKLLNAQLQADVGKLVTMKIATEVEVETTYKGSNRVVATITVRGPTIGESQINLTSERLANEWVWR